MPSQNTQYGSKLDSAMLLIQGMECLKPGNTMPISEPVSEEDATVGTDDEIVHRKVYGMAFTCVVLYSIVVELVLKHIWEEEKGEVAKHNHDVHKLFEQLSPEIQHEMETLYNKCCGSYINAINHAEYNDGTYFYRLSMASLEEALRWNEDAMKDFKYDMKPKGRCMPVGMVWGSDYAWTVPETFPNFAVKLAHWANRRYRQNI